MAVRKWGTYSLIMSGWKAAHAEEFGADGSRIAVAGNSVGGNMTAALTLMAKDRNGPKISYQMLMIPATDASVDTASYHEYGTGRFLARAFMKYGWDLYAPDAKTRDNPYVSPLRVSLQDLHGLPPALFITSENDPLRDEGEAYARKRFSTRRCLWRWRRAPCPS
jgi:acetyl esterase